MFIHREAILSFQNLKEGRNLCLHGQGEGTVKQKADGHGWQKADRQGRRGLENLQNCANFLDV